jgi:hypothetical protein
MVLRLELDMVGNLKPYLDFLALINLPGYRQAFSPFASREAALALAEVVAIEIKSSSSRQNATSSPLVAQWSYGIVLYGIVLQTCIVFEWYTAMMIFPNTILISLFFLPSLLAFNSVVIAATLNRRAAIRAIAWRAAPNMASPSGGDTSLRRTPPRRTLKKVRMAVRISLVHLFSLSSRSYCIFMCTTW